MREETLGKRGGKQKGLTVLLRLGEAGRGERGGGYLESIPMTAKVSFVFLFQEQALKLLP
jgi:hypothetical protein